jgi:aryl-alcohol dehydrogenase-like predicted oxidoreductase
MRTAALAGLTVSAEGLGCWGMSQVKAPVDWDSAIATIRRALDLGVTFLDTADVYAAGHNEVLVGRAIAGRRDEVQLATKVGIDRSIGELRFRGERAYIKRSCEASLIRLGVEHIDLYYLHRAPENCEIEESVGAMAELVREGKVRHLGLSEVDSELLRRAHATHPIAAVQSEYSLWTRDPETAVAEALGELGVGLVAFSPLGRGVLTGNLDVAGLQASDIRRGMPRFTGAAATHNEAVVAAIGELADIRGAQPAQVALAWVMAQEARLGVPVVPIPGTKRIERLEQNVGAVELTLTIEELGILDGVAKRIVGGRY